MALKEHPHVVTTSIPHDKSTITYDITKKNRSTAVGKVYKINDAGKAELPADGEEFDGVIIAVDSTHITAAYMFGGLRVPLAKAADGTVVTVARSNKLVAGVDASNSNAKGYVKAVTLPTDLAALAAADIDTDAEKLTAYNDARTQINNVVAALKGKGSVLAFDTTHALITL
ncbi:hypothetical protein C6502_12745 [Candidatus Poribacteria bacterium]|nr:MAG: hypothetical protein C6502_12745 [Candidatus Poribacteria bacterium]